VKTDTLRIVKAIDWAVSHGARVINMSFAGPHDPALDGPIAEAYRKGVVLIAAAGNDGPKSAPLYPAADPHVIAVTATDADDEVFEHANRGTYVAVAAPGVDVVALAPDRSVTPVTGTSIAAAHVSGVVALLIARNPSLRPEDVLRILKLTTKASTRSDELGAGLVDAYRAIKAATPSTAVGESVITRTDP
jgi:subtilisin family serine protease